MNSTLFQSLEACFPHSGDYRRGSSGSAVHESPEPFRHFPYRERHLQCLWTDPRLRPTALKTSEGESIEVEHPGDWNLEAGPDFRNAVLLIGKEKRRVSGDLEIHIHPGGWNQHGHADDPRYANVRFHIVYFQGLEIPGLVQISLQETLSFDPRFSFENIDLTAYPYSIPSGDFPMAGMHPDQKIQWLESAGEERLRLKAERFAFAMQNKNPEQVLWEELLAALGYKNNKAPFRQLAEILPLARLRALAKTPNEAYALLLGLSGLLPANPDPKWPPDTRKFIRTVWDIWWKQSEELKELALKKSSWNLSGIRPANHPVRRLMASAFFAFDTLQLLNHCNLLTQSPSNHWNTHISWKTKCAPTALVGQSRANAIVTNILIPFQAATGKVELNLEKLPVEPSNSIIRQTAHTLFGPDHTPKVYKSALARQGLIQIFHDYVITHRLDELKNKFGGIASSLSADDRDSVPPLPNRKHPAHHPPIERHNKLAIVFLTVCTHQRQKILASPRVHGAILKAWESSNHWRVGRYVVMPDHIHLFCSPGIHEAVGIAQWVAHWKRLVSQQLPDLQSIWQRDCWDTQLRHHESYTEKWEYFQNNPVRAGLVENSNDWPFQGTVNHLPW
jgi:REP element-mobilizing transposase RayT